jgi:hypothetical protein
MRLHYSHRPQHWQHALLVVAVCSAIAVVLVHAVANDDAVLMGRGNPTYQQQRRSQEAESAGAQGTFIALWQLLDPKLISLPTPMHTFVSIWDCRLVMDINTVHPAPVGERSAYHRSITAGIVCRVAIESQFFTHIEQLCLCTACICRQSHVPMLQTMKWTRYSSTCHVGVTFAAPSGDTMAVDGKH